MFFLKLQLDYPLNKTEYFCLKTNLLFIFEVEIVKMKKLVNF